MPLYRYSLIFDGATQPPAGGTPRSFGWSEGYWSNALVNMVGPFVQNLAASRARLLTRGISIIAVRQEIFLPAGGSKVANLYFPGTNGSPAGTVLDFPTLALAFRLATAPPANRSRLLVLRGLPDEVVVGGGWDPGAIGTGLPRQETLLRNFISTLISAGWRGTYTDPAGATYPISSISDTGEVFFLAANALAVNDRIIANRIVTRTGKPITGRFRIVTKPTGGSATISPWTAGDIVDPDTNGSFRVPTKALSVFQEPGEILRPKIVSRKVGRPFDPFRGRASKRKKRR